MTTTLPNGLVSHTDVVGPELRRFDSVDAEDIAKLWRVYTTNRSTLNDDTGRRLENLFWRIWSSERISSIIRGSTIARLLLQISDGPSSRPEIEHIWRRKQRKKQKKKARINDAELQQPPSTVHSPPSSPTASRVGSRPSSFRDQAHHGPAKKSLMPAPILKKSRPASDDQPKSERITSAAQTEPGAASPRTAELPVESTGTTSPPRKRTTFASTLTSLEEQAGPRSSVQTTFQWRSGGTDRTDHPVQAETPQEYSPKSNILTMAQRHEQPLSSQQHHIPESQQGETAEDIGRTKQTPSTPEPEPALVDKNFRRKFVEQQRRVSASVSGSPSDAHDYPDSPSSSLLSPQLPQIPSITAPIPISTSPRSQQFPALPFDRLGARSAFVTPTPRSIPLSRSSSVQTSARRPAQSQLSKLLEREKDIGNQQGRKRGDSGA